MTPYHLTEEEQVTLMTALEALATNETSYEVAAYRLYEMIADAQDVTIR